MPKPKKSEKKKEFVSRCIPILMKETDPETGEPKWKDNKQCAAICYSMWDASRKGKPHLKAKDFIGDAIDKALKALRKKKGR